MDQNTVVEEHIASGKRLIEALEADGFDIRIAFWAKPSDESKWYLYLASPFVEAESSGVAYRRIHSIMRNMSDLWIDPLDIKVIGATDSLTEAALAVIKPRVSNSKFAVTNPIPYQGMTHFGGSTLAGLNIDGACIYPPSQSSAPA